MDLRELTIIDDETNISYILFVCTDQYNKAMKVYAVPHHKRKNALHTFLKEYLAYQRLQRQVEATRHKDKMAQIDRLIGSIESIAQSCKIIAEAKLRKMQQEK